MRFDGAVIWQASLVQGYGFRLRSSHTRSHRVIVD
jgi:hypothetical protein